jgi:uncharacterized protein (TIGR00730 family)
MQIKRCAVFCSAHELPQYRNEAVALGAYMAIEKIEASYGGSNCGCMGWFANSLVRFGGTIRGAMPRFIEWKELVHTELTEFREVQSMAERKEVMFAWADACVCLPGGYGTMDELFEFATASQLGLHEGKQFKPCGLLNVGGHFDHLIGYLDRQAADGALSKEVREIIIHDESIPRLFNKMNELLRQRMPLPESQPLQLVNN